MGAPLRFVHNFPQRNSDEYSLKSNDCTNAILSHSRPNSCRRPVPAPRHEESFGAQGILERSCLLNIYPTRISKRRREKHPSGNRLR